MSDSITIKDLDNLAKQLCASGFHYEWCSHARMSLERGIYFEDSQ